jgi:methylmalonyl-CoA mutase, C-terminal domain
MADGEYRNASSIFGRRRRARRRAFERTQRVAETHRIVIAKPGLDGHDRGAKIVARALRDAGYEVIYTGLHQTPEQIAETAIQEDADAVGLSCHSGAHMTLFPRVVQLLHDQGADDIVVFGGGIIPREDVPKLKERGIEEIFTPGAPTSAIIEWLRRRLAQKAS